MAMIVDADTHIGEPAAMWEHFDPSMYGRRPVVVQVPGDTWYGRRNAFWLIDSNIVPRPAGKGGNLLITPAEAEAEQARTDIPLGCRDLTDVPARVRAMDELEVDVQIVYPTIFLVYLTEDPELDTALCRAYNRFLADAWAQGQSRLRWVMIPPLLCVDACIDELRFAKEHGAVGVFFRGIEGERTLDDPSLFPVYAEAERLDLPICIHTGAGCPTFSEVFDLTRNSTFAHGRMLPLIAFRDLIANGIPQQFPGLRFGFVEAAASWVPYLLHALKRSRKIAQSIPKDGEMGMDIFRDNRIYVACEADEDIPYLLRYIGPDNLMIGSDYGHNDPSEEREHVATIRARQDVPPGFADKLLGGNARVFYGL
jgi:predicted TIM-barrel fold metal-dependent hydrolase